MFCDLTSLHLTVCYSTLKHITDGWREQRVPTGEIGAEGLQPVEMLNQKVAEGKFGRKSAEGGFFTY